MDYQLEMWKRQDWRKSSRYYCCELKQDLFGRWILIRRWGRISALKGQSIEVYCDHYEQGLELFDAVQKRRVKRGYEVC